MEFKVENGTDQISVGLSDVGYYFRFDDPLSVFWHDRDSLGRYFCVFPYSQMYRAELHARLLHSLNKDFSNRTDELYELLKPLFSLFKNGEYNLGYSNSEDKTFFALQKSSGDHSETSYNSVDITFAETTDISRTEIVIKEYEAHLKERVTTKNEYTPGIIEHTTHCIYGDYLSFHATQPYAVINQERVDYFEKQINNGERPFIIVMNTWDQGNDDGSVYFILDGHHKLLAYQKLHIYPAVVSITYILTNTSEKEFDAEKLSTLLYPWQTEHLLKNWRGKDKYIADKLKNIDSPLYRFVKNGHIKEYHENKKLKHEAFYINGKVEGKLSEWYDNGQLKCEYYYHKGNRAGVWNDYYPSGNIQFIQPFDEEGRYHGDIISYYENGQKGHLQSLKNGRNTDGFTNQSWFENGDKEAKLRYANGQIIERKNWNPQKRLVSHEVYDAATKKLVKVDLPSYQSSYSSSGTPAPKSNGKETSAPIFNESQTNWKFYVRIILLIIVAIRLIVHLLRN